jgi:hypothetical protein
LKPFHLAGSHGGVQGKGHGKAGVLPIRLFSLPTVLLKTQVLLMDLGNESYCTNNPFEALPATAFIDLPVSPT